MIVPGAGKVFLGYDGGDFASGGSIGAFDGIQVFQLDGQCVVPPAKVKEFTSALLTATVTRTFSNNFGCYFEQEDAGPDKDGWEPRVTWER